MIRDPVRYLVFDVESVADGDLIARTRYPGQGLSAPDAIRRFQQELLQESGRDFIPYTFHIPVSVVVAKVAEDLSLIDVVALDEPEYRPQTISERFWQGWLHYNKPIWVTFNGRGFDLPLMELAAFRYGLSVPEWFNLHDRTYAQRRNRYNLASHIDLQEVLTNFGSTWFRGGLNLAAQLIGQPGKIDVSGQMVQQLYDQGRVAEINNYCRCDVLDTYFVFLQVAVLTGQIDAERHKTHRRSVRQWLEQQADKQPAYRDYLENWPVHAADGSSGLEN
jgi:predicted PolB exonuclease-like 3'-5' exonuclease